MNNATRINDRAQICKLLEVLEIFFRYADGREIKEEDYAYLIDSSYSARGDNIDSYIGTSPDENIFQRKYSLSNNGQVLRIHNVGMSPNLRVSPSFLMFFGFLRGHEI